jgi:hypothetical protein
MLILFWLLTGCQQDFHEPEVLFDEFSVAEGFLIECIAAEPLLDSPVAMAFDDENRIWVVEMPGYMPNADGEGENMPSGKIVILSDRDKDGKMDHRQVFLDSLVLPRALALVYGGLLFAEPPNLWFVEIKRDKPGKRTLVDSLYASWGNVEHQPNGLWLHLDNWIYSAKSDARYRLREGKWEKERTYFRGQWGITADDWGRLLYNDNSNQLLGDHLPPGIIERNLALVSRYALGQQVCTDQRVYPLHATSVNRGYQDGVLDSLSRLRKFTSACGPVVYTGGLFTSEYAGNTFVCAPEANLVKRNLLEERANGSLGATQAWQGKEFLASTDETFRPVNLFNGPDGALYVLDMRRGIIQHKTYLTFYLREQLEQKGLDTVSGKGRIYRIAPLGKKMIPQPTFSFQDNKKLVENLCNPNGWIRRRAQQLLIERQAADAVVGLESLISTGETEWAAVHALWTLEGLGKLNHETIVKALQSKKDRVVEFALHPDVVRRWEGTFNELLTAAGQRSPSIDLRLVSIAGGEQAYDFLSNMLVKYAADTLYSEAALSGLAGQEEAFGAYLCSGASGFPAEHPVFPMLREVISRKKEILEQPATWLSYTDQLTRGLELYRQYCSICHRPGGEGIANVAPPLRGAETLNKSPDYIFRIIWNGKSDPIRVDGKTVRFNNPMPAFKDNPAWKEEDAKAVAAFVKNAFGEEGN